VLVASEGPGGGGGGVGTVWHHPQSGEEGNVVDDGAVFVVVAAVGVGVVGDGVVLVVVDGAAGVVGVGVGVGAGAGAGAGAGVGADLGADVLGVGALAVLVGVGSQKPKIHLDPQWARLWAQKISPQKSLPPPPWSHQ